MSHRDGPIALPPTRIDIPPEIRLYVTQLLQQSLACIVDLRSHVKQAGWNVKGHDCAQLQALFTSMATTLDTYSDLLAERLVVLGGVAWGTARTVARHSTLQEYPAATRDGQDHVGALADRFASYATLVREGITRTAEVEDAGSAAIYTDLSRGVDRQLSVLEAYLSS